jgi:hypothetical protein
VTRLRFLSATVALVVTVLAVVTFVRWPDHAFLVSAGDAEWIRADRPFRLAGRRLAPETVVFRRIFHRGAGAAAEAVLHVRALRSFRLSVNGRRVGEGHAGDSPWRNPRTFDLSPYLEPGTNELRIEVVNDRGPPALLAWSPTPGIATGTDWKAQGADGAWKPAGLATEGRRHAISAAFPTAWQGLRATWPLLLVAFALGAGAERAYARWLASRASADAWRLRPAHVRWLVMSALALLSLHDLTRLDIEAGFDARAHFDYIRYVAANRRLPLATEGWQTFQPPLFYLLAAPPYFAIAKLASEPTAMRAMRLLVLACGLGLVEMVGRGARAAFPRRDGLQMLAIATGGLLPTTVYMSQYVSNEPLAGVLTAALVVAAFRLLAGGETDLDRWGFGLGLLFGLAILAKVTVALLLPLLVAALLRAAHRCGGGLRGAIRPVLRFALASAGVAGWYFARNWIALGHPYLGGWDTARGIAWIQDPGYRVPADLLSFGASLHRPVYAALSGLWDGIYSTFWLDGCLGGAVFPPAAPPWHYDHAVACALLALPLTAAGVVGMVRSLRFPRHATEEVLLFATAAVGIYLAAIFAMFLRLPIYSTVKSTYTMGLAPCYGALFAWGFDLLPKHAAVRALLVGYLAAWLAFVFRAYFI